MGEDRVQRLAKRLQRTGAHYDDPCFQQFIFFPLPDGNWEMLVGRANEYHASLWRRVGRDGMAEAWGVGGNVIPWSLETGLVATGYVDFKEVRFRDIPFLVIPKPLPDGWTEAKIKGRLDCGSRLNLIEKDETRSPDPKMVQSYIDMIKRAI